MIDSEWTEDTDRFPETLEPGSQRMLRDLAREPEFAEDYAPEPDQPPITTVADDGTLIMLPPVGDAVRAALVRLKELVRIVGTEQTTGMIMIALSHIAAALDQHSRTRNGRTLPQSVMEDALRRVSLVYVPDLYDERGAVPRTTEWRGEKIVTFVEDDSLPKRTIIHYGEHLRHGIFASLDVDRSLFTDPAAPVTAPPPKTTPAITLPPRTTHLPEVIHFKNDNINRAAVSAFAVAATWKPTAGLRYGVSNEYKGLTVTVGLPETEVTDRIWSSLSKGGARMVKAHYALWARWYEEGGEAGDYINVGVNQFCADIGYTKHHKGGFRREHKQEAMNLLEALTTVQISAEYQAPGTTEAKRLRGGLWARGMIGEQKAVGDGGTSTWEAVAFTFAPGPWFTHPAWARHNKFVGKVGAGLLQLDNREEWAILLGGYLATLMRTNAYQAIRVRANTILSRTGLAQSDDMKRRSAQMQQKFENAMDLLIGARVIVSWTWPEISTAEADDMDDPDSITEYYSEENLPKSDWWNRIVEIVLPFEEDESRLIAAREKAKRASRTPKKRAIDESH